jgi:hypothetical protein
MRSSQLLQIGASVFCAAGLANAAYTLEDSYDTTNFFNEFSFFSAPDPTQGFVDYVAAAAANQSGLAGYSNNAIYMGVDHTTVNPTAGRESVRVSSNKAYTKGLIIADIAHMPDSICGSWPAFWTFGPDWPGSGEIDIIEGVNGQTTNSITLHSGPGCTMAPDGATASSKLTETNCNAGNGADGCGFETTDTQGFGTGFNAVGGGVYAAEWTSTGISVYFFARAAIPADITSGQPNPSNWGAPVASFSGSGCDIDSHFQNHNIVFDTTFCGQWAGSVWSDDSTCSALAPTCNEYVAQNPSAFVNAYWLVNSVKVYQDSGASKRDGVRAVPFLV